MICQAGHFLLEENQMARRSDERDAARAEYIARMEKDGEVNLRQLADDLHLKYDTVRRWNCLLYTSPSPRDYTATRIPSSD